MADSAAARLRIRVAPRYSDEAALPSYDLQSLCALAVLQNARVPLLVEPIQSTSEPGFEGVTGVSSIIRSQAPAKPTDERAYLALALSRLSALIEHSLFSLPTNFTQVTRPSYAEDLPIPARYIVPGQLRLRAKERLEREGLWNLGGEVELDEKKERKTRMTGMETDLIQLANEREAERKERMKREFDKLKIVELAKEILAPFAAKLGSEQYFGGKEPSTLDAVVFAHLALVLYLPLPTATIATLLKEQYPALAEHAHRMRERLFPLGDRSAWPSLVSASNSDWSLLSSLGGSKSVRRRAGQRERDELSRQRWQFIGATAVTVVGFVFWQGIVALPSLAAMRGFFVGGDIRALEDDDEAE